MQDRRVATRYEHEINNMGTIYLGDGKEREEVQIIDVSSTGMRVFSPNYRDPGTEVTGRVPIFPDMAPFYVSGKVLRAENITGLWELAVQFDKVRVYSFF
ncbi:MAG: PilZ domain-containing protein [Endomicrobiales bacterium]|nr:PilZ domain-containing protein [Endomicrobiales bacterium]